MDLYSIFVALESTAPAIWVRDTLNVLPVVNAFHILAVVIVFGTIFVVDLRLIGVAGTSRPFTRVADDGLKWTWFGFAIAVVSGLLMFSANATTFYGNVQFWFKMAAIAAAGINMLVFELVTVKSVQAWDQGEPPPRAAKIAGLLSILFWASVIVLGRWIGYSKGFNFGDVQVDLNALEGLDFLK